MRQDDLVFDSGGIWCEERRGGEHRIVLRRGGPGGLPFQQLKWRRGERIFRARIDPAVLPAGSEDAGFAVREPLLELWAVRQLRRHRAWLVHGALFELAGLPVLAVGQSGAGKSTLCRLVERAGHVVYCDDRVILRPGSRKVVAWSTPWHGEARYSAPGEAAPVAAVFLRHGRKNRLVTLGKAAAVHSLVSCSFGEFWHEKWLGWLVERVGVTADLLPCFRFEFRPAPRAVDYLHGRLLDMLPPGQQDKSKVRKCQRFASHT